DLAPLRSVRVSGLGGAAERAGRRRPVAARCSRAPVGPPLPTSSRLIGRQESRADMSDDHLPAERMRASDSDRDAAAERLALALSEGRLDLTEYDERLSAAMHAKNVGELARLTEDLPPVPGSANAPVDLAEVGSAHKIGRASCRESKSTHECPT